MVQTVREILFVLDNADTVEGLDLPGLRLPQLKGERKGYFAMTVRANWRIVFWFASGDAYDGQLIDYH
jgi:proteic killer suppression protein